MCEKLRFPQFWELMEDLLYLQAFECADGISKSAVWSIIQKSFAELKKRIEKDVNNFEYYWFSRLENDDVQLILHYLRGIRQAKASLRQS